MDMIKNFFSFNKLLTPTLIKYIYWILSALIIISGVFSIFGAVMAIFSSFFAGIIALVMTLIGIPLSLLFVRVLCEKILVTFLIEARLRELNQRIGGGRG